MIRQHPDNPNLFWCPRCSQYKNSGCFNRNKIDKHNIGVYCRECAKDKGQDYYKENAKKIRIRSLNFYYKNHETNKKNGRVYYYKNAERRKSISIQYYQKNKERILRESKENKEYNNKICQKARTELANSYVKKMLKQMDIPQTTETIEMTRQRIIMKRTLKEFQQWRKDYESNHTDVH